MNIRISLVILLGIICTVGSLPNVVNIVGIFGPGDARQEIAFKNAVARVNREKIGTLRDVELIADIISLKNDDSFYAANQLCLKLPSRMTAIFGPSLENTANHVQSLCNFFNIPHIETRWNYETYQNLLSVNLYPHPKSLGQSYYDIVKELGWKNFVILYDSEEGLSRLQSLLKSEFWTVSVRQLADGVDWRPLLKEIKKLQVTKFVLDLGFDKLIDVLDQAQHIGLMSDYHSYFITTLDPHLIDLSKYKLDGTNITGVRLLDPEDYYAKTVVVDWKLSEMQQKGRNLDPNLAIMTTEGALMYDAVQIFARGLDVLSGEMNVDVANLHCNHNKKWEHGGDLIYRIKNLSPNQLNGDGGFTFSTMPKVMGIPAPRYPDGPYPMFNKTRFDPFFAQHVRGLTGEIKFDLDGFRTDFEVQILEFQDGKFRQVGTWDQQKGALYSRTQVEMTTDIAKKLQNRTLRVTTALAKPYTYLKDDASEREGNDRFEGFCIDLIDEVARYLGFNYTISLVRDGAYGSKNSETGEWNGMVRELLDHEADVGIVDFTITTEREGAVDFSMPFMNLGISIVYKKPSKAEPNMLQFMAPFSVDVWIYIATAYLGVSVLLFILARMVPAEWDSPHPCIQDPDELENPFTLLNCLWLIIATFMGQGGDIAPRAVSTRIVTSIWWFFTLIMIASYTANLAAFLTVSQMQSAINTAEDLAKQTKIKYGSKFGGSTYTFFKNSKIPTYQRMWAAMSAARPSVFPNSNEEGIDRVSKADGMYAFLMESSSIEYVVQRKCDLMQVGGLLDSKSYGIALPPGSPYTGSFSQAILKLKERGIVMNLKKRWWEEKKGGGACGSDEEEDPISAAELGMDNVGGVFVVMGAGFAASVIIACCEFLWKARKLTTAGDTWWEGIWNEIVFVFKFTENSKTVRKPSPAESDSSTIYSFSNNYGYANNDKHYK